MRIELEGFEVLSDDECRELLAQGHIGRVAVSVGALPAVLPVNYRMLGDSILFFTSPGRKLRSATANEVVAFEVDSFDEETETGWSVMAVGVASEVTAPEIVASARRIGVRPWATGERPHLVRIRTEFLSGRRIAKPAPDASIGTGGRPDAGSPAERPS